MALDALPQEASRQARLAVVKALFTARRYRANVRLADATELVKSPLPFRREGRAALAAVNLAWQLAQIGEGRAAVPLLEEALAYFSSPDRDDGLTPELLAIRKAQLEADPAALVSSDPETDYYRDIVTGRIDTANLLLDAVEYGRGNWDRSIDFAEVLYRARPTDETRSVLERLRRLKSIAGGADIGEGP